MFYYVIVSKQYVYATVTTFPHLHFFFPFCMLCQLKHQDLYMCHAFNCILTFMCGFYALFECVELSLTWPWEWDCREQWSGFHENCDNCAGVSAIVFNVKSHT